MKPSGRLFAVGFFLFLIVGPTQGQTTSPLLTFGVPSGGVVSLASKGTSSTALVGFGRIQPSAGTITPFGLAIFGFRQGNVLVSEATVPASSPILAGRTYAEVSGPVNTGLAIANPNNEAASIRFFLPGSTVSTSAAALRRFRLAVRSQDFLMNLPLMVVPRSLGRSRSVLQFQ